MTGAVRTVAFVAAAALMTACGGPGDERSGPPSPSGQSPESGPTGSADLRFSFDEAISDDDGSSVFLDVLGGPFRAQVVTANGGAVASVPGPPGRGAAIELPAKCTASLGCPRAMVEVAADPQLNPGEATFSFGASVWLSADQTAVGSNIVQKGRFGTDGGQWKLQVDGLDGEPSCVVRSGPDVLTVRSRVSIADGAWHQVTCRRDAQGVSIAVDDVVDREAGGGGSVDNELPIRVGSPGVGDEDDQFHGRIDDVFLSIEP